MAAMAAAVAWWYQADDKLPIIIPLYRPPPPQKSAVNMGDCLREPNEKYGIPQVAMLGPVFTSNLDDRAEWFLNKFVHDIESRPQIIMLEDKAAIQVVFSNLDDKLERNLLKFSKDKCKVCTE
ncbi:hypothetical protein GRJ2_002020400 [Grus japonensis]|uniref:Uncharacterized protein n=1 Tax=Grus japonensis TaxID=30415 RepID=A0ABC9XCY4_GRUJA